MPTVHDGFTKTAPMQPIETDEKGVQRFKANKIVSYLIDNGSIDMNALARLDFSDEDRRQFAQLIGYSLSGYSGLSYVDDLAWYAVVRAAEQPAVARAEGTLRPLAPFVDRMLELLVQHGLVAQSEVDALNEGGE